MADIQNANWQTITAQFEAFRDDIHRMRNCDQLLFTSQQINFNFDTVASLLSLFYSNVKSYRAALFAYRLNLLISLPALLNKFVPMSLLDRPSLEKVLTIVQNIQNKARDRLTLAIPFQETLSYYESQVLQDIVALPEGLLITMSIPLASRQTVLTTYEAIPLPMPQHDDDMAMIWDTHADFLAVSEDGRETASVSRQQLDQCIGSSRYSICQQGFATEGSGSSCLSLLFFGNLVQAMKVCESLKKRLTLNLAFGSYFPQKLILNFVNQPAMIPLTCPHEHTQDVEFASTRYHVVTNCVDPISSSALICNHALVCLQSRFMWIYLILYRMC